MAHILFNTEFRNHLRKYSSRQFKLCLTIIVWRLAILLMRGPYDLIYVYRVLPKDFLKFACSSDIFPASSEFRQLYSVSKRTESLLLWDFRLYGSTVFVLKDFLSADNYYLNRHKLYICGCYSSLLYHLTTKVAVIRKYC